MRLWSDLSGRLSRAAALNAVEFLLLILIAIQAARLAWALFAPVGPLGDWRAPSALATAPAGPEALAAFDPFFRLDSAAAPAAVTALNLKLYGVRVDQATGRGSAIIGLPDGTQKSFGVGEEIVPGVVLNTVDFDNVAILRGGAREQIFLDQSTPAPAAAAPPAPRAAPLPGDDLVTGQPAPDGANIQTQAPPRTGPHGS